MSRSFAVRLTISLAISLWYDKIETSREIVPLHGGGTDFE